MTLFLRTLLSFKKGIKPLFLLCSILLSGSHPAIAESSPLSPPELYERGTQAIQAEDWNLALGYLYEGLRQVPWDSDLRHNYAFAIQKRFPDQAQINLDPGSYPGEPFFDWVSPYFFGALFGVGALGTLIFLKNRRGLKIFLILIVSGSMFPLAAGLGWIATPSTLTQDIQIRSGPGESYLILSEQKGGTRVRVLPHAPLLDDQKQPWLQIRFTQGKTGWIPASALLLFSS